MDTLECMRVFVAVARKESFTAGAKILGISTKLASKSVAQLESRLGARLLYRTTRSVSMTETGITYLNRCAAIVEQLDELEDLVQQRQVELAGPIRITAPTGFGSNQLIHALRPFQLQHPKVALDLYLSDQHVALVEEGFDLAIRFGVLEDSSLVARKLMDMRVVVFASPQYLRQHGCPSRPEDLVAHDCILSRAPAQPNLWQFNNAGQTLTIAVNGAHQANAPRAVAHMVAGGIGIGRGPLYSVAPFLETGELQMLLEAYEPESASLYAVYPTSRHLTARIRALIDHLVEFYRSDQQGLTHLMSV